MKYRRVNVMCYVYANFYVTEKALQLEKKCGSLQVYDSVLLSILGSNWIFQRHGAWKICQYNTVWSQSSQVKIDKQAKRCRTRRYLHSQSPTKGTFQRVRCSKSASRKHLSRKHLRAKRPKICTLHIVQFGK